MPVCSASGCPYQPKRFLVHRSTHAFPLNKPALCREWVRNVGRKGFTPTKTSRLCSAHFEDSCFQEDMYAKYLPHALIASNRVRAKKLKPDAVPTRFLHRPQVAPKPRDYGVKREERRDREDTLTHFLSIGAEQSVGGAPPQGSPETSHCEAVMGVGLRRLLPAPPAPPAAPPAPPPALLTYTLVQTRLPPHLTAFYAKRVLREHAYCTPSQLPLPPLDPPHSLPPPADSSAGEQKPIKEEQEESWVNQEGHQEGDIIAVIVKSEDEEERPQCCPLQCRQSEVKMKEEASSCSSGDLIQSKTKEEKIEHPPHTQPETDGEHTHHEEEEEDWQKPLAGSDSESGFSHLEEEEDDVP